MGSLDLAVLIIYLLLILCIGWFFRIRQGGHDTFFLAGRNMGWFPIGLSVMVTTFSAINYLAFPNEVFSYGLYVLAALPVFFIAAWPITKIWMPFFHDMKLTSAYEYLEYRFSVQVRSLASGIFILWRLFWMATALYASGKIMSGLTGIGISYIILVAGLVATVYTFIGGMQAVMWTDVMQFFVLFGGILAGIIMTASHDGISSIIATAFEGGRLKPFYPFDPSYISLDPRIRMTLWSGLIGVFVAFLSRYGADQVVMQRYFTAKSLKMAQRGLWLNACVSFFALSLLAFFGLAVYAMAIKSGAVSHDQWASFSPIQKKEMAMKQLAFVIKSFPPGITGLVVAGLLAATMSSIDSGINACSAAYVKDFHERLFYRNVQDSSDRCRMDRVLTIVIGLISTVLALVLIPLVGKTGSLFMIVNKLINAMGSPLLAIIVLGMFSRKVNSSGMLTGGLIGLIASISVSLFVKPLALQYYAVLNVLVTILPCYLFSYIFSALGHADSEDKLQWLWSARSRSSV